MKLAKELWYLEGSPAAKLAKSLEGEWTPRALSPRALEHLRIPKKGPQEDAKATLVVCLVDLARDDYDRLLRAASRHPEMRVVALAGSAAQAQRAPDGEFFALLPTGPPAPSSPAPSEPRSTPANWSSGNALPGWR